MRQELIADLLKIIMDIVGEESITVRREYDSDGNCGLNILIGIFRPTED